MKQLGSRVSRASLLDTKLTGHVQLVVGSEAASSVLCRTFRLAWKEVVVMGEVSERKSMF